MAGARPGDRASGDRVALRDRRAPGSKPEYLRLRDPALTIESVAAELGMSVGHPHRLFNSEALSPSPYLWRRRPEACSRELPDPRRGKASVAAIAFAWGFNDAAHFGRASRERFRASPREWRRQSAVSA
jgi:AraC-like DNA-binding protein